MKSKYTQLIGLGGVVSAFLLYLALRDMNWHALWQTLLGVKVLPLIFCGLMLVLGVLLRGWRWSLIADRPAGTIVAFVRATNLGILANQLLPARLGEVVRVIALRRMLGSSLSESAGSALVDRIVDVVVLFLSAWLVSTSITRDFLPRGWLDGLGLLLVLVAVGLLVVRTRWFRYWLTRWSERWLHRWSLRPDAFILIFNKMVGRLTRPRSALLVLIVAVLAWLSDYLAVLAALWSVDLDLPLVAPLLLWVMLAASSALPSAPGYLGVYQLAAVLGLAAYNVPSHHAIAVSLILQALVLIVSLAGAGNEVFRIWSTAARYSKGDARLLGAEENPPEGENAPEKGVAGERRDRSLTL